MLSHSASRSAKVWSSRSYNKHRDVVVFFFFYTRRRSLKEWWPLNICNFYPVSAKGKTLFGVGWGGGGNRANKKRECQDWNFFKIEKILLMQVLFWGKHRWRSDQGTSLLMNQCGLSSNLGLKPLNGQSLSLVLVQLLPGFFLQVLSCFQFQFNQSHSAGMCPRNSHLFIFAI